MVRRPDEHFVRPMRMLSRAVVQYRVLVPYSPGLPRASAVELTSAELQSREGLVARAERARALLPIEHWLWDMTACACYHYDWPVLLVVQKLCHDVRYCAVLMSLSSTVWGESNLLGPACHWGAVWVADI